MKNPADNRTLNLLPPAKKRGRPASGKALTPAERKRKQREQIDSMVWSCPAEGGITPDLMPITALIEGLAQAVRARAPNVARALADELVRRASA